MGPYYSTFDVVKLLGINRATLKNWMDEKLIRPSIRTEEGRGLESGAFLPLRIFI